MSVNRFNTLTSRLSGAIAAVAPLNRGVAGVPAPRHAGEVRPAASIGNKVLKWLWTALFLLLLAPFQAISAQNGDQIVNRVVLHTAELPPIIATVSATIVMRTPSTIELMKYAPGNPDALAVAVQQSYYSNLAGTFEAMNPPVAVRTGAPIDTSSPVPLLPADMFHSGEPVFIMVTDRDQNINKTAVETIFITITDPVTGDSETLRLSETGPDTGIFTGCIQTTALPAVKADGILSVVASSSLKAAYVDKIDGTDSSTAAALVDPLGIVFDTLTGKPVNGATVELLNADGTPATVYGDNGQTTNTFPNAVISGGTAQDKDGNTYTFSPGGYRFPYVNPGDYIIKVTPPGDFTSPSTVTAAIIQNLPGAPFAVKDPGSRGEIFSVPLGPAIHIDLPVDPRTGTLWLTKTSGKNIVSSGEYLNYDLTLENNDSGGTVFSPLLTDILPAGFRYQPGSVKINGQTDTEPVISPDGRTLTFKLSDIPPATSLKIRYVIAVGAGAKTGTAVNTAFASAASPLRSNVATAKVLVQEPFMQSSNIIMGRVFVGACSENAAENKKGMGGIGIFLEDGTFVISDEFGKFHFEGIRPGTHIVQLDLDSIPAGYKVLPCEQNSRFAGRSFSQFVDLQGGTMWRTDFYLGKIEPAATTAEKAVPTAISAPTEHIGEVTLEMFSSQSDDIIDYRLLLNSRTVPLKNPKLNVKLPATASYIPGSSTINGMPLADPELSASSLVYALENTGENWLQEIQFRAKVDKKSAAGELETSAILNFDTASAKNLSTPAATNTLAVTKEEKFVPLPLFIFRPHFPTFGAELSDTDRLQLDELIRRLSGKIVERIDVTGHTDNVRIAPRSRAIYQDNHALSLARAKSVGRYLTAALHLPPAALYLNGSADKEPVATNRTAAGRALNRRVEVKISALEKVETAGLKVVKERSGLIKQTTTGKSDQMVKEAAAASQPTESASPSGTAAKLTSADSNTTQEPAVRSNSTPVRQIDTTGEYAELVSVLNDGVINYRIMLKNSKTPFSSATVTLSMPKSLLYIAGTSLLSGKSIDDPEIADSKLVYRLGALPDQNKFYLGLQALVDDDTASDPLDSSVRITVSDDKGKVLKTLTAATALSEEIKELSRTEADFAREGAILRSEPAGQVEVDPALEYIERLTSRSPTNDTRQAVPFAPNQINDEEGIVYPRNNDSITTQITGIRVILSSLMTPSLAIDGNEVSADLIGFSMKDSRSEKSLYSFIGVDIGAPGRHTVTLKGIDSFGNVRFQKESSFIRTGDISRINILTTEDNIADGRTPLKIRVQLLDSEGNTIKANSGLTINTGDLRPYNADSALFTADAANTVKVDSDGWMFFQPVTTSGLYRFTLGYNKNLEIEGETYVKPKMRDWILVGLAEGTTGYNTISKNMESAQAAAAEDNYYSDERVAFYAKGTVKGEWLLTMAYDSDKQRTGTSGNSLFQTINPESYYTIYGDGSSQLYDAASQEKLYLRIERDQFSALFGDYNTGLTVTELSRYSRSLTGIKSEFRSKNFDVTVFGSETGQSFVKDELRGDGTSGLYRLTKSGIVINSEKITIESRDRFHSEVITASRQLNRFIDYSIDYDNGTIFFKSPVPNRDDQLNPVYIMVDYETLNAGKESLTYGGRAAARALDGKVEVGGTYVREGHVSGDNTLFGVDATAQIAPGTKARAEFATTDNNAATQSTGNAYLAEVTHTGKKFDGRVYFKEQESGFGLGQQNASEGGTRKYGIETGYRLSEKVTLNGQAYRQYNLADDAIRDFIEVLGTYNEKQYALRTGLRYANDTLPGGKNETSVLATVGGSWRTKDQKLTLRADHDQALFSKNNSTDFPTRTIFGIDYQAAKAVTLFVQEELTYGESAKTNTTTAGIKSTPWSGGTLNTSVVNDLRENSERTFANVGLAQKWQISPSWGVDGEVGHSETVRKKDGYTLNSNVPPASGGTEFTAVSLGANYSAKKLLWSNRAEFRTSPTDDKWGVMSGLINEHGLNWGWTGRLQLTHNRAAGGDSTDSGELRFGLAYRPPVSKWIVLNRLDLTYSDVKSAHVSTIGKRLVNNLNANYRPNKKTQVSIQYGAKYVLEKIDGRNYSGYTDLIGIEGRFDISKEWDLGVRGSLLHSWETEQYAYSVGGSVGYNVMENAWISGGYNLVGFTDKDFSAADYTAQGPFIQYRMKFDQQSIREGLKLMGQ